MWGRIVWRYIIHSLLEVRDQLGDQSDLYQDVLRKLSNWTEDRLILGKRVYFKLMVDEVVDVCTQADVSSEIKVFIAERPKADRCDFSEVWSWFIPSNTG